MTKISEFTTQIPSGLNPTDRFEVARIGNTGEFYATPEDIKAYVSQTFSNTHTATSLATGANSNFDLNLGRTGVFTIIESDKQAWLSAYISDAARTADASRLISEDPDPSSGVLFDVIFTGAATVSLTPTVSYWATANVFFRLKNTDSTTQTIVLDIDGVRFN